MKQTTYNKPRTTKNKATKTTKTKQRKTATRRKNATTTSSRRAFSLIVHPTPDGQTRFYKNTQDFYQQKPYYPIFNPAYYNKFQIMTAAPTTTTTTNDKTNKHSTPKGPAPKPTGQPQQQPIAAMSPFHEFYAPLSIYHNQPTFHNNIFATKFAPRVFMPKRAFHTTRRQLMAPRDCHTYYDYDAQDKDTYPTDIKGFDYNAMAPVPTSSLSMKQSESIFEQSKVYESRLQYEKRLQAEMADLDQAHAKQQQQRPLRSYAERRADRDNNTFVIPENKSTAATTRSVNAV